MFSLNEFIVFATRFPKTRQQFIGEMAFGQNLHVAMRIQHIRQSCFAAFGRRQDE